MLPQYLLAVRCSKVLLLCRALFARRIEGVCLMQIYLAGESDEGTKTVYATLAKLGRQLAPASRRVHVRPQQTPLCCSVPRWTMAHFTLPHCPPYHTEQCHSATCLVFPTQRLLVPQVGWKVSQYQRHVSIMGRLCLPKKVFIFRNYIRNRIFIFSGDLVKVGGAWCQRGRLNYKVVWDTMYCLIAPSKIKNHCVAALTKLDDYANGWHVEL